MTDEQLRMELLVGSLAPHGSMAEQEALIERLESLEHSRTAEVTVRVWGRRVCPEGPTAHTDGGRFVLDRLAAFRAWAADSDRSLEPFFREEQHRSAFTGESYPTVLLPSVALAEFRGDDLAYLTPHVADGRTVSVADRLDALERDRPDPLVAP